MNWTKDGWPICPHCDRDFRYDKGPKGDLEPPPCCGVGICWAKEYWSLEDWRHRARFAHGKMSVHLPLTEWDQESLNRTKGEITR